MPFVYSGILFPDEFFPIVIPDVLTVIKYGFHFGIHFLHQFCLSFFLVGLVGGFVHILLVGEGYGADFIQLGVINLQAVFQPLNFFFRSYFGRIPGLGPGGQ